MLHHYRVLVTVFTIATAAMVGGVLAAPAYAAEVAAGISASAAAMPLAATVATPTPTGPATGVQKSTSDTEVPVAEPSSGTVTPIIMVAGLGMLFASIFLVVRSGNTRREHSAD